MEYFKVMFIFSVIGTFLFFGIVGTEPKVVYILRK